MRITHAHPAPRDRLMAKAKTKSTLLVAVTLLIVWGFMNSLCVTCPPLLAPPAPSPPLPSNITRDFPLSLLILQGIALSPFKYYKGLPSLPSNITRDYPLSLLI